MMISFWLSKLMSREFAVAMADVAMHEQAIDIGGGLSSHSRVFASADLASVDAYAVPREAHAPRLPAR